MKIAITGIGIISALGVGAEQNRENLLAGKSRVAPAEILRTEHKEWPVGEVGLSNAQLARLAGQDENALISRNALLGMIALKEAIADSRLSKDMLSRMQLLNGTTVGGMDLTEQYYKEWQQGDYTHLDTILQHEAGMTATMLQQCFGLADSTTISTACSSALNAIVTGVMLIRAGIAKRVIAGGTEALTRFHLNGFGALGILSKSLCKPFDAERDGINLGEGAAYVVLEDAEDAKKRGAKIYAYVAGYGNRCDAYHATASSPEGDGAYEAMAQAVRMSGLDYSRIKYLNAHGTATPNNDASEMRAIERLYGENMPLTESTKPLTGHTTSASGSIELCFTVWRMSANGYRYAMSNAFGFGGNDTSIILSADEHDLPPLDKIQKIVMTESVAAEEQDDYKTYIPAMQARRMTPMLRQLVVAAKKALQKAGIEMPDAIVVGTEWGGMIPTIELLKQLTDAGEEGLSPMQFMSSTHNNAAGTLARLLSCKGYNTTFSHGKSSMAEAEAHAALLLMSGEAKSVLVCGFDEVAEGWQEYLERAGMAAENIAIAKVMAC